jgi:hypothetical protein
MRDALLTALVPVLSTLLVALAGWVSREAVRYLSRRSYAADREALRVCAESVVADLAAREVEPAREALGWTAERKAEVRAQAVALVRALEPIAVATLTAGVGAAQTDVLLGALVEQAVARAKRPAA